MAQQRLLLPTQFNFQEQFLQKGFMSVSSKNSIQTEQVKRLQYGIHYRQEQMVFIAPITTCQMHGTGMAMMLFY